MSVWLLIGSGLKVWITQGLLRTRPLGGVPSERISLGIKDYCQQVSTHRSMSVIRAMASLDALGMRVARGVAENCGNLKFIPAASLKPSGHSLVSGVPSTEQILKISSISELPGNKGLEIMSVYFNFSKVCKYFASLILMSSPSANRVSQTQVPMPKSLNSLNLNKHYSFLI